MPRSGYEILTRSDIAGVDIFARQLESRFIFFQGHPEYDASSLQREYMRDLARFLSGERDSYPNIPVGYFDAATVAELEAFEQRARAKRDPMLAAELPGLTLRPDIAAGAAANTIFRNWLGFLREEAREPGAVAEVIMPSWSNFTSARLQPPRPASLRCADAAAKQAADGQLHLRRHSR